MQACLGTTYKRRSNNGYREEDLVRCLTIPVDLKDVEFYAGSDGSVFGIVAVKVSYRFHNEEPKEIWVSPKDLYDSDVMPLDDDKHFWLWCKKQWLRQQDPEFDTKFADVHRRVVVERELEDQDAFDAVEALGFPNWAADIILNIYW